MPTVNTNEAVNTNFLCLLADCLQLLRHETSKLTNPRLSNAENI